VLAFFLALFIGMSTFELTKSFANGAIEMTIMMLTFIFTLKLSNKSWFGSILPLLMGYGFAWFGHFVFEKNRPATFIYPSFSLLGE
jgi:hypothetical protein